VFVALAVAGFDAGLAGLGRLLAAEAAAFSPESDFVERVRCVAARRFGLLPCEVRERRVEDCDASALAFRLDRAVARLAAALSRLLVAAASRFRELGCACLGLLAAFDSGLRSADCEAGLVFRCAAAGPPERLGALPDTA
jgi:hypothetical protein